MGLLNSALTKYGIQVRRVSRPSMIRTAARRPSAGLVLEFVGTQGVGKSTLFRNTLAKSNDNWFCRSHLHGLPIEDIGPAWAVRVHRKILFDKIESLRQSDFDGWQCSYAVGAVAQVVRESLQLAVESFPRGFAMEEGLFKNMTREVLALEPSETDPLWQQRAFIYVKARDVSTVVNQYKARIEERRKRGLYQHAVSAEWIAERAEADGLVNDRLIEEACRRGRPVLVVHAEDQVEANVDRILAFERRLLEQSRSHPQPDGRIRSPAV